MWKSLLVPALGVLLLPVALHGQQQHAGHGVQAGMQMGRMQADGMMHRNIVRELVTERAALDLTAAQVERLEPLAARLDAMNATFEGMHKTGAGRTLSPAARDSMRAGHMAVRRTNEQEVLNELKAILGAERYVKALELLVVRRGAMH